MRVIINASIQGDPYHKILFGPANVHTIHRIVRVCSRDIGSREGTVDQRPQ